MNESQFPWLILVPSINNIRELHDLSTEQQVSLIQETSTVSELLLAHFQADKINIGALGNLVPQFHMHVVVRHEHDVAWPNPIWGNYSPQPYAKPDSDSQKNQLIALLKDHPRGL